MSENTPSKIENIEEGVVETTKTAVEVNPEAIEDLRKLNEEIKFKGTETHRLIREALANKDTGAELLNETGTSYKVPPQQHVNHSLRNKFMAGALTLVSFLGLGKVSQAEGDPADSLNKKQKTEEFANKIEVKKGLTIREVTNIERQEWNAFIDFVESKGLQGSEKLDKGSDALARSLFAEYKKLHPSTTLTYDLVPSVQYDMQRLKQSTQDFARRHNNPNANNLMNFVSKVDGWFGSQTSKSKFPFIIEDHYHNDTLVSSKNLGLANGNLETQRQTNITAKIPKGAKLEKLADGTYYQNDDGDLVKVSNN